MTQQSIGIFLPCRQGSQRVPLKNINPIGKYTLGLFEIKIRQLLAIPNIEIYLSTDDKIIIDYVSEHLNNNRVKVFIRDPFLASATTSTDDLVMHAHELVQADHILWTHVTSPFITKSIYESAIEQYFKNLLMNFDSLMSVSSIYSFIWDTNGPINYNREHEKWPRTQTIKPLYEINSGIFISSKSGYSEYRDRIGTNPFLFKLEKISGLDVDDKEDYKIVQSLILGGYNLEI